MTKVKGLQPIFTSSSKILILGTFPSEKSRESGHYYDHNGNRFWKVICDHFRVPIPNDYEEKEKLLKDNDIAVWDLIDTCEIDGSKNSTIKNPKYNDIQELLNKTDIKHILLNGRDAFEMYEQNFKSLLVRYTLLPNTSRGNFEKNFDKDKWFNSLWLVNYYYRENEVERYVKSMNNNKSPFYETIRTNSGTTYKFDNYWVSRIAVENGVSIKSLTAALLIAIENGIL